MSTHSFKRKIGIILVILLLTLSLLSIFTLFFGDLSGKSIYQSSPDNQLEIGNNIQLLKDLEAKTPEIKKISSPAEFIDLEEEQNKILSISPDNFDLDTARSWFANSVILGDSISYNSVKHGFLGTDVVLSEIGVHVLTGLDQFEMAKARYPSVAFLCFGLNDLLVYEEDSEAFMADYVPQIMDLKASLPDLVCYVVAIAPSQDWAVEGKPGLAYYDEYNEALKQFCEETEDVYFIDANFILENNPDIYDPEDGIHPLAPFYPMWMTFLADMAGLSDS